MVTKITSRYFDEKHEECGVVGIYSKTGKDVAPLLYKTLMALQHRGQDAAGFAVFDGGNIDGRRGIGLVDQIFKPEDLEARGSMGIGHTRYPTLGECHMCDVQPFVFGDIAVVHNGHIANYSDLKKELEGEGYRFTSTVDSEAITFILNRNRGVEAGVRDVVKNAEGAYSVAALVDGKLVIFRDPYAIRPLVWGENKDFVCFCSETVALDIIGIPYKGEVKGGEMVVIDRKGITRQQLVPEKPKYCMFEYVYFSRPDSTINARSVYEARRRLGAILAAESPAKADVVVPVPDTSRIAAESYARTLGVPCEEGLIKNRYIGRTFIMPDQGKRIDAVKLKLNPVREVVGGRSVVLVDDSIVRGTTLKEIVSLVRSAGAKEVHLRITCPPVRAPCFYGVDMSTYNELIANRKSVDEIGRFLGADSLAYISLDGLKKALDLPLCTACLNEEYHTDYVRNVAKAIKAREI
jgi:amidophosphoribosyltransferase